LGSPSYLWDSPSTPITQWDLPNYHGTPHWELPVHLWDSPSTLITQWGLPLYHGTPHWELPVGYWDLSSVWQLIETIQQSDGKVMDSICDYSMLQVTTHHHHTHQ
jgi:hypothetical protein